MKKILSLFLAIAMIVSMLPKVPVTIISAETPTAHYTGPTGGKFIAPIEPISDKTGWIAISNRAELEAMANNLSGKYYLTADIDLSGKEWVPIGDDTSTNSFKGIFDGQGYIIRNMTITGEHREAGLFVYISNDSAYLFESDRIKNTGLEGTNIDISNRSVIAGGISSKAGSRVSIYNCYNTGSVTATVTSPDYGTASAGGIVGVSDYYINNCYNTGNVTTYSPETSKWSSNAGGISGKSAEASKCYNTGVITSSAVAGGISGNSRVYNCYNTGAVTAYSVKNTSSVDVGGIVGSGSMVQIVNCYNTGDVSATFNSSTNVGGIYGSEGNSSGTNCYWNNDSVQNVNGVPQLPKRGGNSNSVYITTIPLTTAQMKQQTSFVGFDFDEVWAIHPDVNNGMPYLRGLPVDDNGGDNPNPQPCDNGHTLANSDCTWCTVCWNTNLPRSCTAQNPCDNHNLSLQLCYPQGHTLANSDCTWCTVCWNTNLPRSCTAQNPCPSHKGLSKYVETILYGDNSQIESGLERAYNHVGSEKDKNDIYVIAEMLINFDRFGGNFVSAYLLNDPKSNMNGIPHGHSAVLLEKANGESLFFDYAGVLALGNITECPGVLMFAVLTPNETQKILKLSPNSDDFKFKKVGYYFDSTNYGAAVLSDNDRYENVHIDINDRTGIHIAEKAAQIMINPGTWNIWDNHCGDVANNILNAGNIGLEGYLNPLNRLPNILFDRMKAKYGSSETAQHVGVSCPVDVEIYENNQLIAKTKNNIVTFDEYGYTISVVDDFKYIYIPYGKDYTIKITAFDEGTMGYFVTSGFSSDGADITNVLENIPLVKGKMFFSEIKHSQDGIRLFVVDENDVPIAEVLPDGTERKITNIIGCGTCKICTSNKAPVKGRILGNAEPQIFDALEILKSLVGMSGAIDKCLNARNASLITKVSQEKGTPTIFDALEILKHLVGMIKL